MLNLSRSFPLNFAGGAFIYRESTNELCVFVTAFNDYMGTHLGTHGGLMSITNALYKSIYHNGFRFG